ncbi:hypothetical protein Afil01_33660 [Actinorhabdospora filicis]|uniref:Uncharacterized protein n=1 Tax=Actinorhabdospora filicis TaxID=1785913 RepID=A0A9W6W9F3_9ACTN|nr:hypothetical protein [Actinorhabdospora filicis]GLZ78559.1 hypothetical protein Afil01_33660 [Actinorhabdospora filicis]
MGEIIDRVGQMVVRATSPDNRIMALFKGGHTLEIRFRPGVYDQYARAELEHQLSQLGPLVWTGYRRGLSKIITDVAGASGKSTSDDEYPERRRYKRARAELVASAMSPRKCVRAEAVGLLRWDVHVKDGTQQHLSEAEFCGEITSLVDLVINDHNSKINALQREHLGLRPPETA